MSLILVQQALRGPSKNRQCVIVYMKLSIWQQHIPCMKYNKKSSERIRGSTRGTQDDIRG